MGAASAACFCCLAAFLMASAASSGCASQLSITYMTYNTVGNPSVVTLTNIWEGGTHTSWHTPLAQASLARHAPHPQTLQI